MAKLHFLGKPTWCIYRTKNEILDFMKPTKRQIKKWTIPSLASYKGYLNSKTGIKLAIVGLIIGLLSLYPLYDKFEDYRIKNVKIELSQLLNKKEWETMGNILLEEKKRYHNKDWFNYYCGYYSSNMHSVVDFKIPEYYLLKIDPESDFFDKSVLFLLQSYLKIDNKWQFEEKMSRLIKTLEEKGYNESEYFLAKLLNNRFLVDENELSKSYNLIKLNYEDVFSKKAGNISFVVKKVGEPISMNFEKLGKIYGISFLYIYYFHKNKLLTNDMINDIKTMFPNQETFEFALYGVNVFKVSINNDGEADYRGFINTINEI